MAGVCLRRVCGARSRGFEALLRSPSIAPCVYRSLDCYASTPVRSELLSVFDIVSSNLERTSTPVPTLTCGLASVLRGSSLSWQVPFSDGYSRRLRFKGGLELVDQSRGFAAKSKKAKSKADDVPDDSEDIASTAKLVAVRMMENALDALSKEHSKLRTGRASAGMLDHITVEAHGVRTPLSHVAAVAVSGLQTLSVMPYDSSMVKEVEKSILNSPLGLNPQVDGFTLTVPLPRLTKEHCETMCKLSGKAGETAKLTLRRARKEALDMVKKSGDLSKDESKRFEKEIEEFTKTYTRTVDETCKKKEKEILM